MFEKMTPKAKKLMADIIFWVINQDAITADTMSKYFNVDIKHAKECIHALADMNIVGRLDSTSPWYVLASEPNELHTNVIELLIMNGYNISKIITAFKGLPLSEKTETSKILSDNDHAWVEFKMEKPEVNKPVAIRIVDTSKISVETRTEVMYLEDIKIASWNGSIWKVEGPHPKYDFSLLSDKADIDEDAEVTHWAPISDEGIKWWRNRLNPINHYEMLEFRIDEKHEKNVYQSIILAAACLMKEASSFQKDDPNREKYLKAHAIMCDLQSVIDHGIILNVEEGKDDAMGKNTK